MSTKGTGAATAAKNLANVGSILEKRMTEATENLLTEEQKGIKTLLESLDNALKFDVVVQKDGGVLLQGPFPTFCVFLGVKDTPDGYAISVNADAPSTTYYITELLRAYPNLVALGPYAEKMDGSGIEWTLEGSYALKEQHIVARAMKLIESKGLIGAANDEKKLILPPEKKIIAAS